MPTSTVLHSNQKLSMASLKRTRLRLTELWHSHLPNTTSEYTLDMTHRGGTHSTLLELVPRQSRVLELGCASGYFGAILKQQRQCKVWGIDSDITALQQIPQGIYESTNNVDLDHVNEWPLPLQTADVVLMADLLEHLIRPEQLLIKTHDILAPDGLLIISLPNIAHISVRISLLFGKFRYKQSGILDRTHLHLYTFHTACELINNTGFTIENIRSGSNWSGWLLNHPNASRVAKVLRGLLATNIIITARPQ